jgi:hypothetical protein
MFGLVARFLQSCMFELRFDFAREGITGALPRFLTAKGPRAFEKTFGCSDKMMLVG